MLINLRNIFARMNPTQQDVQTLSGVIRALVLGRQGPARGGVLDGEQAAQLRELVAERGRISVSSDRPPARGLAKLLRRNPTDAERALWDALTRHRRFAGLGFKRQVPVGPFVTDITSFPLRTVIDILPAHEEAVAGQARAEKRAWLQARNYRIVEVTAADIAENTVAALERLADEIDRK
jgi:tRNA/rRNA methyltransferase